MGQGIVNLTAHETNFATILVSRFVRVTRRIPRDHSNIIITPVYVISLIGNAQHKYPNRVTGRNTLFDDLFVRRRWGGWEGQGFIRTRDSAKRRVFCYAALKTGSHKCLCVNTHTYVRTGCLPRSESGTFLDRISFSILSFFVSIY